MATAGRASLERFFLFFPTHRPHNNDLTPWRKEDELIGYARLVESPRNVWLMLHGNAGQASDRLYAMPCFGEEDAVFVLEYPGYGGRSGIPSKESFNQAATESYLYLRETYPQAPVGVAAESLGSGPAASLASLPTPPPPHPPKPAAGGRPRPAHSPLPTPHSQPLRRGGRHTVKQKKEKKRARRLPA